MSIFSNILGGIKNVAGGIGNAISGVLGAPSGSQTASTIAPGATYKTQAGSGFVGESTPYAIQQPTTPSLLTSITSNPIIGAANSGGTIRPSTSSTYSLSLPSTTSSLIPNPAAGNTQTAIPGTQPGGQSINTQTPNTQTTIPTGYNMNTQNSNSNQYSTPREIPQGYSSFNKQLNAFVPNPQALSGASGASTQTIAPQSGTAGASGGGMSNFLGVTGTGNTGNVGTMVTDEDKNNIQKGQVRIPTHQKLITDIFATFNNPEKPLMTGDVGGSAGTSGVPEITPEEKSALGSPEAASLADYQETVTRLQGEVQRISDQIAKTNPIPESPVVDTPEQSDFLNSLQPEEQMQAKTMMDQFREQVGLPELEKQRIEAQIGLQGVNEAYQGVIDDIKANPDLPKGLANRRLQEVYTQQKQAAMMFTNQLEIITQQISDANSALNQAFKIQEFQADEAYRTKQSNLSTLELMIDSGAIGGFTDADMAAWSDATGISLEALNRVKKLTIESDDLAVQEAKADIAKKLAGDSGGTTAGTATERATQAASTYQQVFVPGATYDGKTILNSDGYINQAAWIDAISDAPGQGLSREQFIEMFGYLIPMDKKGNIPDTYKLTEKEKKLITG